MHVPTPLPTHARLDRLGHPAVGRSSGLSLVELLIVLVVLTISVGMLTSTVTSTSHVAPLQRENALASEAARTVFETMRTQPFEQLFALYNEDPSDDPDGPGSAPGPWIQVQGLIPADVAAPAVGRIRFPTIDGQLRQDVEDVLLGMPRDLTGNGEVNDQNVADRYIILPVEIELEWQSTVGPRSLRLHTMFIAP